MGPSMQGKAMVMRIVRSLEALVVLASLCLVMGVSSASAATVVKKIPIAEADAVSSDGTHVWVTQASQGAGTVSEIDASTGTVVKTITVGSDPYAVSSDGTHVWVVNRGVYEDGGFEDGTVSEIDAATGTVVNTITVGNTPDAVSSDGTHVWVTNGGSPSPGTVSEIDASTGTVVKTITVGGGPSGGGPDAVSSDGTHVWVAQQGGNVSEIDASTGTLVKTIPVAPGSQGVSSDGTHVWVTNRSANGVNDGGDTVTEIDASTGTIVKTITVGSAPIGVSSDGTDVWVTNYGSLNGTVSEIDASTDTVVNTITVGGDENGPTAVSSDGTHVWVVDVFGISEIQISAASTLAPAVSKLRVSPRRFSAAGREAHGRCVKLSKKNQSDKRCQLSVRLTATYALNAAVSMSFKLAHKTVTRSGVAGSNKFSVTRKLAAGTYELTATPAGGTSQAVTFKVTG